MTNLRHAFPISLVPCGASLAGFLLIFVSAIQVSLASTATYRMTVNNTWSDATHPSLAPLAVNAPNAHFSHIGGATHNGDVSFWEVGQLATPGIKRMAEAGGVVKKSGQTRLEDEVDDAISDGDADSFLAWEHWFCPDWQGHENCGGLVQEFNIEEDYPLLTLVTMLGPSPDWFVGVSGLNMRENGQWKQNIVVDLFPYDGGTRTNNVLGLGGPLNSPPLPISLITAASGQIITPASLGTMTFELLSPLPDPIPGDFDGDFDVDGDDLVIWLSAYGTASADGDANGDGRTDGADFLAWQRHITPSALQSVAAVPEPSGLGLCLLSLGGLLSRSRMRSALHAVHRVC